MKGKNFSESFQLKQQWLWHSEVDQLTELEENRAKRVRCKPILFLDEQQIEGLLYVAWNLFLEQNSAWRVSNIRSFWDNASDRPGWCSRLGRVEFWGGCECRMLVELFYCHSCREIRFVRQVNRINRDRPFVATYEPAQVSHHYGCDEIAPCNEKIEAVRKFILDQSALGRSVAIIRRSNPNVIEVRVLDACSRAFAGFNFERLERRLRQWKREIQPRLRLDLRYEAHTQAGVYNKVEETNQATI